MIIRKQILRSEIGMIVKKTHFKVIICDDSKENTFKVINSDVDRLLVTLT